MYKKVGVVFIIIAAFFLWREMEKMLNKADFQDTKIHVDRTGTGYLINPLLECELSTFGSNQKYIPFESDAKNRIQKEIIDKNKDLQFALYFRNLRNGPWFWIDEETDYAPASLMKLPIAISYMKWSEYMPEIRNATFSWVIDIIDVQNIKPTESVVAGNTYSLDELIKFSLIFSDNNANETLLSHLPKDIIYKVFTDLNLPIIDKLEAWTNDYISVKEYASFFRVLYNASYLSDLNSSYLLDVLSKSAMTWAIRASVPNDIVVAHKFWERRLPNPDWSYTSQFHDCGIVYHPNYPYVICIMTKWWDNIPRLERLVKDTSAIIFDEINKRYTKEN